MQRIERVKEFGGWLTRYTHASTSCHCEMTFSIYLPEQAAKTPLPVLYWLSGLTCDDDNFRVKAGAQRYAAALGLVLVMPDTSPRGEKVADARERYDLGQGAGFYVNATRMPWAKHYQMYDYVVSELPALIEQHFPVVPGLRSISGHSMGGHGALLCALKNPGVYASVSAFAPICHPSVVPWGQACFSTYLGDDVAAWKAYDATELVASGATAPHLLIDQGTGDEFLAEQLSSPAFLAACQAQGLALTLRQQPEYDHSYHFIATFIGEHLQHHHTALMAASGLLV